jgi:phosphoribosylanthranilate isomerase
MIPSAKPQIEVKVCGLTRLEDVKTCDSLGIDWVGFNFWPHSKRFIRPELAKPVIASLTHAQSVGVFVNPTLAEVLDVIKVTGIQTIQLHGDESWDFIQSMPLPVIKAIPANRLNDWGGLKPNWTDKPSQLHYWLIDTPAGAAYGGTGQTFDWSLIAKAGLTRPFFLAGGLGPNNLAEASQQAQPFAVDLNSKVEVAPGIKDGDLIRACLQALRRVD